MQSRPASRAMNRPTGRRAFARSARRWISVMAKSAPTAARCRSRRPRPIPRSRASARSLTAAEPAIETARSRQGQRRPAAIMRSVRAFLVLAAFFLFTLPLMPLQLLFLRTGSRYARTFPHWYHRQVCRIVGIRLNVEGGIAREHGVLIVSNHVSWLDITVLSAVAPVSFVAKQEVASWPFVSWLAKLQRSVFVDRTRRSEAGDKANEILNRLEAGDHIVLFAEGTSSDGNSVVPFKTALFAAAKPAGGRAMGSHVSVQTLALTYTK